MRSVCTGAAAGAVATTIGPATGVGEIFVAVDPAVRTSMTAISVSSAVGVGDEIIIHATFIIDELCRGSKYYPEIMAAMEALRV